MELNLQNILVDIIEASVNLGDTAQRRGFVPSDIRPRR